jgi:hypothetical protein
MNVVTFDPKTKADERREELLEILEFIKQEVEEGRIKELVACSIDDQGLTQIHVSTLDLPGGIGLFEIGKHILYQSQTQMS